MCGLPSRTRVVAIKSFGQPRSLKREKSTAAFIALRSGSISKGSNCPGDSDGPNATEVPTDENPPISINERNEPSSATRFQNRASRERAPSRPPSTNPHASNTALTAPALAPLMVSSSMVVSSKSRSRTPHVKAPNEPPPCSARDSRRGGQPTLSNTKGSGPGQYHLRRFGCSLRRPDLSR